MLVWALVSQLPFIQICSFTHFPAINHNKTFLLFIYLFIWLVGFVSIKLDFGDIPILVCYQFPIQGE